MLGLLITEYAIMLNGASSCMILDRRVCMKLGTLKSTVDEVVSDYTTQSIAVQTKIMSYNNELGQPSVLL